MSESKNNLKIKAEKRDIFGKKLRESRKEGKLPAVFYPSKGRAGGSKKESTSIFIDQSEFGRAWKKAGESTVLDLEVDNKVIPVLIYKVDLNPLTSEPIHVDFYAVDMTKKVSTTVPFSFVGEAPAVKLGGTLVEVMREIEVEAMPADLPHEIEVDVSVLENFESKITIGDLKIPEGVSVSAEKEDVIAFVEEAKEEEEEVLEEAVSVADIEVEKKGKQEDESEGETPSE